MKSSRRSSDKIVCWLVTSVIFAVGACGMHLILPSMPLQGADVRSHYNAGPARSVSPSVDVSRTFGWRWPSAIPESQVLLGDAECDGLVKARAIGAGFASVVVELKSNASIPLRLLIPAGTTFVSDGSVRNMIVRRAKHVSVPPGESVIFGVAVTCLNMRLDAPSIHNSLAIQPPEPDSDLTRLVSLDEFETSSFDVQQFAAWTLTENPARDGYVGLGNSLVSGDASGPSEAEFAAIRRLFIAADILPAHYPAIEHGESDGPRT